MGDGVSEGLQALVDPLQPLRPAPELCCGPGLLLSVTSRAIAETPISLPSSSWMGESSPIRNVLPSLRRHTVSRARRARHGRSCAGSPRSRRSAPRGTDGQRLADHLLAGNRRFSRRRVPGGNHPAGSTARMASSEDLTIAGEARTPVRPGRPRALAGPPYPYWPEPVPGSFPAVRHGMNSHPELSLVTIHPVDSSVNSTGMQSNMICPIYAYRRVMQYPCLTVWCNYAVFR